MLSSRSISSGAVGTPPALCKTQISRCALRTTLIVPALNFCSSNEGSTIGRVVGLRKNANVTQNEPLDEGVRGKGRSSPVDQWILVAGAKTWTYVFCTIDVPTSNFEEDNGENLPGLVLFCGRGIHPGKYTLVEFADEGMTTLDDEASRSCAFESSDEIDDSEVVGKTATSRADTPRGQVCPECE